MVRYGSWISSGWKPSMNLWKIYKNEANLCLVLLIDRTPFFGIEGAHLSLVLVVDPCYHVNMPFIYL